MSAPASLGSFEEVLSNLELRFLASLSEAEVRIPERLFFQLEQAWWFYEDNVADHVPGLPHYKKFEMFARIMFTRSSTIQRVNSDQPFETMYAAFKDYQHKIPVYGACLLTADLSKVLLITGFRSQNNWGFPKGKINQGEDEFACGLREVYEEVGYNASGLNSDPNDFIVHSTKSGKYIKLFIIPGVPEDYPFAPRVVKEIGEIKWWKLTDLPDNKTLIDCLKVDSKDKNNKFWGAAPFIPKLRAWVVAKKNKTTKPKEKINNNNKNNKQSNATSVTGGDGGDLGLLTKLKLAAEEAGLLNKKPSEQKYGSARPAPSGNDAFKIDVTKTMNAVRSALYAS